jgi:hypothetical protein
MRELEYSQSKTCAYGQTEKRLFACVRTHFVDIAYAAYDTAIECGSWPLQRVGPLLYVPPSAVLGSNPVGESSGDRVGFRPAPPGLGWLGRGAMSNSSRPRELGDTVSINIWKPHLPLPLEILIHTGLHMQQP